MKTSFFRPLTLLALLSACSDSPAPTGPSSAIGQVRGAASLVLNHWPTAFAYDQLAECTSELTGSVTLDGSLSSDPDGDPLTYTWKDAGGNVVGTTSSVVVTCTGLGSHAYTLTVDDGRGGVSTDDVNVNLVDTTPPEVTWLGLNRTTLDPPNNKMVLVGFGFSLIDVCSIGGTCRLTSVSSNEPAEGDIQIIDSQNVYLRAKRDGNGDGRVYTLTITCEDASGNAIVKTLTVTVPKGKK